MMIIRRSNERGFADHGWLKSFHTFSFANYHDPAHMGFGPLRVINEDRVAAGQGFGKHGHRDMEILSWVLDGVLEHKDSLGTGALIRPGEMQRMSAGTGVAHSEFNGSKTAPVHFLQIWILPERDGLPPGYEQRSFTPAELENRWCLAASGHPRDGAVRIHQDVDLYVARLDEGRELEHVPAANRKTWLQVARGAVDVEGEPLEAGDGAAWAPARKVRISARAKSEILLFDMAP
jgi:redox-sensitive bicupin YhaK (pirin superfamily)